MYLLARSNGDPAALTSLVREEIRIIDPDLPLFRIETMDQSLAQQRWGFRVFGTMFAMFAAIALVLSAVGLYAVTAYSVAQRTQEIGVRMALGARPAQVRWLVLRRGLVQTAIGLVLGLAGAVGVGRLLESILVQTSTRDAVTLISVVFLLAVVSIAACLAPAPRDAAGSAGGASLRIEASDRRPVTRFVDAGRQALAREAQRPRGRIASIAADGLQRRPKNRATSDRHELNPHTAASVGRFRDARPRQVCAAVAAEDQAHVIEQRFRLHFGVTVQEIGRCASLRAAKAARYVPDS